MPSYKALRGVTHNIGHSFTSLMNYSGGDYVMGHVLRFARLSGSNTLTIDLVSGQGGPPELLREPISDLPVRYSNWFLRLVKSSGSDRSYVRSATLTLRYDTATQRRHEATSEFLESPYWCDVFVTDTRGKQYTASFSGWWYPEKMKAPSLADPPWWKFWLWDHPKKAK